MGREQNRIIADRIAEAVAAAENKYFHKGHAIKDITDIPKFGYYLLTQAIEYGKLLVKSEVWRSNYPLAVQDKTIDFIRKRMEHYRKGIIERDKAADS